MSASPLSPPASPPLPQRPALPRMLPVVLALAVVGISVSGPLARLSTAPPLAIAVWRLTLSLGIVAVPLLVSGTWRELARLRGGDVAIALAAGTFLALHFWSWIASLGMTSVAASVLLVNLHPVVIVLGGALWLGERPTRAQLAGLALAMLGAAVVALGDVALGDRTASDSAQGALAHGDATSGSPTLFYGRALLGNGLALLGAITVGLYYLAGRRLRQQLSLWPYVALVYGACWVVLLALAGWQHTPLWPQPPRELGIFALIALGPMLAGHTGFNWALRYVPAVVVSVALLLEPIGAGLVAWLALGEVPSPATIAGGAVVFTGLALALRGERGEAK